MRRRIAAETALSALFAAVLLMRSPTARADDAQPTAQPMTLPRCSNYFVVREPADESHRAALNSAVALIAQSSDLWIAHDLSRGQARSLRARIDGMAKLLQDGRSRLWRYEGYRVFLLRWSDALQKLEPIRRFVESLPDGTEKTYYQRVLDASVSALFRHSHVALSSTRPQEIDVARVMMIIDRIATFEPARARFTLYRIKREIERGYSLREFTLCL